MDKNKNLVAVYGSLRKGFGNHDYHLGKAVYLGTFSTEPIYSLHSLGPYPGLKENGSTSIVMEVYEVTDIEASKIDNLEGYVPGSKHNNFYDKKEISTPWGLASVYVYINNLPKSTIIENGDWKSFKNEILSYHSIRNN